MFSKALLTIWMTLLITTSAMDQPSTSMSGDVTNNVPSMVKESSQAQSHIADSRVPVAPTDISEPEAEPETEPERPTTSEEKVVPPPVKIVYIEAESIPDTQDPMRIVAIDEHGRFMLDTLVKDGLDQFTDEDISVITARPLHGNQRQTIDSIKHKLQELCTDAIVVGNELTHELRDSLNIQDYSKVTAHRCNTLSRAEECLREGADMIEVDVRFTLDGVAVLVHNNHIEHKSDVANPWKRISQHTVEQLKSMDPTIATLAEVLEVCKGRAPVLLDVKDEGEEWPRGCPRYNSSATDLRNDQKAQMIKTALELANVDSTAVLIYTSKYINKTYTSGIEEAAEYRTVLSDGKFVVGSMEGWTNANFFEERKELGVVGFDLEHTFLDRSDGSAFLSKAHEQGFWVSVWTINDDQTTRRRAKSGVDFIQTDYPSKWFPWKKKQ